MPRKDYQGSGPAYKRLDHLNDWVYVPGSDDGNIMDVPMAETARASIRNAVVNRDTTYGARGKPENFGVNEESCIAEADRYDEDGFDTPGLRIPKQRKFSKFTGRT